MDPEKSYGSVWTSMFHIYRFDIYTRTTQWWKPAQVRRCTMCGCGVVKTCCFYNLRLDKLINLDSIRIIFYKHLILKEQKNYLRLMSVSKWVSIFKNKFLTDELFYFTVEFPFFTNAFPTLQLSFPSSQMCFLLYSWVSLLHKCVSYFTVEFPFFTNAFPSLQVSILSYKCVSFYRLIKFPFFENKLQF